MNKSDLMMALKEKDNLSRQEAERIVNVFFQSIEDSLGSGGRVEIRGFGSFSLHHRAARTGRNPKTGDAVQLPAKFVPHFKPGKELRERVNIHESGETSESSPVSSDSGEHNTRKEGSLF